MNTFINFFQQHSLWILMILGVIGAGLNVYGENIKYKASVDPDSVPYKNPKKASLILQIIGWCVMIASLIFLYVFGHFDSVIDKFFK